MTGLCKEDKGEGRWETVEAYGGYLCSPQTEKYILCYRQSHTPTSSSFSVSYTLLYTRGRMLIPGPLGSNVELVPPHFHTLYFSISVLTL